MHHLVNVLRHGVPRMKELVGRLRPLCVDPDPAPFFFNNITSGPMAWVPGPISGYRRWATLPGPTREDWKIVRPA